MNETTTNSSISPHILSNERLEALWRTFWIYTFQGFYLVLANSLVLLPLKYRCLRERNSYLILASLAFIDLLNGLACLIAGVSRNYMIVTGVANNLVSGWQCLFKPWNLLWVLYDYTYGPTLFIVSVDRFIAVVFPFFYFVATRKYFVVLILCVYLPLPFYIALAVYPMYGFQKPERPIVCFTRWIYDDINGYFNELLSSVTAVGSIVIYIFIIVFYTVKHSPPAGSSTSQMKIHMKTQKKLTVTLGFSSLFTFIFHVCPLILKTILSWSDRTNEFTAMLNSSIYVIQNINPMFNIILYIIRQDDLRVAIRCVFYRKELTEIMLKQQAIAKRKSRLVKQQQRQEKQKQRQQQRQQQQQKQGQQLKEGQQQQRQQQQQKQGHSRIAWE